MKLFQKIKGWTLAIRLRLHGHHVGRGLTSAKWNPFACSLSSKRRISIGDNVHFGKNLSIWVKHGAELMLDDKVVFTGDSYIRAAKSIRFGECCSLGEFFSIRDSNHGTVIGSDILSQPSEHAPIVIGRDVWIGAGSRILMGATIPDGCVIGANSTVLRSSPLEPNGIYGGSPVKLLKFRQAKQ